MNLVVELLAIIIGFSILAYVAFMAYAKEYRVVRAKYILGFKAWKTYSKSDFIVLAKKASKSPQSLRSMYQNGFDIIFYPISGIICGLVAVIRNTHLDVLDTSEI